MAFNEAQPRMRIRGFYVKRGQLVSLFPFYWLGVSCIEQRNLALIRTLVEALLGLRCTIDSVSLS
ncbi:hypothetical protein [Rubritalea tangerina]|uniref:hypothetical protein n=1 Tax=Rubritalea tangerina TaxID=430798 RepID=UPI00361A0A7D